MNTLIKTTIGVIVTGLVTISVSTAQGPGPEGKGKGKMGQKTPPLVTALDTDADKTISAAEIAAAPAVLATLDTDGDGSLSKSEISPKKGGAKSGGNKGKSKTDRPTPPMLIALDTDADGNISAAEIQASATSLLTLDTNGDKALDKTELRPKRK